MINISIYNYLVKTLISTTLGMDFMIMKWIPNKGESSLLNTMHFVEEFLSKHGEFDVESFLIKISSNLLMSECKDDTQRFVLCCKDRMYSKSVKEEMPEKYNLSIKNLYCLPMLQRKNMFMNNADVIVTDWIITLTFIASLFTFMHSKMFIFTLINN